MKIAKSVFSFLPFLAIIFAAIYFHHINARLDIYLSDLRILFLSFILLIAVFISQAIIWRIFLLRFNIHVSFNIACASQFRSILMKYIPGKIWAIVGRAHIVSQHGYSLKYCSFVSALMQIVSIISGLMIGVIGMLYSGFFFLSPFVAYAVLGFLIICLVLFSREIFIPKIIIKFLPKTFHQFINQRIPPITDIILLCGIHWILLGSAFFLFFYSITLNIGFYPILLQPLANNIGIISSFAPGGLGVREGVMIGYLTVGGLSVSAATGISIVARLWFCTGELSVFIFGWFAQKKLI